VFSSFDAAALKCLTEAAQTLVSRLGKMLITNFLPLNSSSDAMLKSDLTSLKSGALLPVAGRLPVVLISFPFKVIFAIIMLFVMDFVCVKQPNGLLVQSLAEYLSFFNK
jgi:hypothetical protein